jgi:SAM-dependent methyltransferase
MNVDAYKCRLCGNESLNLVLGSNSSPATVEHLLSEKELLNDEAVTLQVFQCKECDLVQLKETMPVDFYEDYEMAVSFSESFLGYLRSLVGLLVSVSGVSRGRLLEIGCGDGTFLQTLDGAGFDVTGVEPSDRFRSKASAKGFNVHKLYLDANTAIPGAPFDIVVTRQVLEHVPDINGFLIGLKKSLTPGGFALIEVPSLEIAIADRRFFDFFPDHVNYFSQTSLKNALNFHGFSVRDVRQTMAGEFNTVIVCNDGEGPDPGANNWPGVCSKLQDVAVAMPRIIDGVNNFLADCKRNNQRVAVWGSGGKGVAVLAALSASARTNIEYVIDSDTRKHLLFMPVAHHRVYPPDRLIYDPVDVVLVTALAHLAEIVEVIRSEFRFSGEIVALGETLQSIEPTRGSER